MVERQSWSCDLWQREKPSITSVVFLPKMRNLNIIVEEIWDQSKLRNIFQNSRPIIFKMVTVMKAKGSPRNCARLKKTWDVRHDNSMHCVIRGWLLLLVRTLWGQLAKMGGNIHWGMGYHVSSQMDQVEKLFVLHFPTFFVKLRFFQNKSLVIFHYHKKFLYQIKK